MLTDKFNQELIEETKCFLGKRLDNKNLYAAVENKSSHKGVLMFTIKVSADESFEPEETERFLKKCHTLGLKSSHLNKPLKGLDGNTYKIVGLDVRCMPLKVCINNASTINMSVKRLIKLCPEIAQ